MENCFLTPDISGSYLPIALIRFSRYARMVAQIINLRTFLDKRCYSGHIWPQKDKKRLILDL